MAIHKLSCAGYLLVMLLVTSLSCADEPAPKNEAIDSKALADALVKVSGDESAWFRSAGLFAISREMGVPEAKFRQAQPGNEIDRLPPAVLTALHNPFDDITTWTGCFGDQRETQIAENDLFGGGSSEKAKNKTCADAAMIIVLNLVPAKLFDKPGKDAAENRARLTKAATQWSERVRGKSASERMQAWLAEADTQQRLIFLAVTIQMAHEQAYPLLEANFLARAKTPDNFLYLELGAYFRHRRAAAKKFYEQIEPVLRKHPVQDGRAEDQAGFLDMWKLLTNYDKLDAAITAWQAGQIDLRYLNYLLQVSIDQPWAYHSMGIESTSVFRPTMEQNLRALVAAAAKEPNLPRRIELLQLGKEAAKLLTTIIHRTHKLEQGPPPRSNAPQWQAMVDQLREMFKDARLWFDGISLARPRELAADIVWEIWEPADEEYDAKNDRYLRDWRKETFDSWRQAAHTLKIPAAEYLLSHPEGVKPVDYPEDRGAALVAKFAEGDAVAWRKLLASLPWEERLMLLKEETYDKKLPIHIWPRLIQFVDWTGADKSKPDSFGKLWQEKLAGKTLDQQSWQAINEWLVSEARAQRYWSIVGESSPARPGISLYVLSSPAWLLNEDKVPLLLTSLTSEDY
jgi:hypothetical protein